jgi:hypothetical protein
MLSDDRTDGIALAVDVREPVDSVFAALNTTFVFDRSRGVGRFAGVPCGRIFALTLVRLAIFVRGLTICVGRDADFVGVFSVFVEKGDFPGELAADDVPLSTVDALPLGDFG